MPFIPTLGVHRWNGGKAPHGGADVQLHPAHVALGEHLKDGVAVYAEGFFRFAITNELGFGNPSSPRVGSNRKTVDQSSATLASHNWRARSASPARVLPAGLGVGAGVGETGEAAFGVVAMGAVEIGVVAMGAVGSTGVMVPMSGPVWGCAGSPVATAGSTVASHGSAGASWVTRSPRPQPGRTSTWLMRSARHQATPADRAEMARNGGAGWSSVMGLAEFGCVAVGRTLVLTSRFRIA
jgi:hypothetical protein